MFRCEDCGAEFEEFAKSRESHGEVWNVCPMCGSSDWKESAICEICGDRTYNKRFCDDCMRDAKKLIRSNFTHMPSGHLSDLIDLFTEALDAVYIEERRKEWTSGH